MNDPAAMLLDSFTLVVAFCALNLWAFAAFAIDKERARRGDRRIRERTLLALAFWGGSIGAYAGRAAFRHKTRKQPFSGNLHTIATLQAFALAGLLGWIMAG